jgi:hypothetical protein
MWRQNNISLVLSAVLAVILVWQAWPVAEPVIKPSTTVKSPASTTDAPKPDKAGSTTAVVLLPPPPTPQKAVRQPLPEPVKDVAASPSVTALQSQNSIRQETAPDLLQNRPPLKPALKVLPRNEISRQPVMVTKPAQVFKAQTVPTAQPVQTVSPQTATKGRALLRVLEHGKGPGIHLNWPKGNRAREELSHQLRQCFGMQLALMSSQGLLFVDDTRRGEAWRPNRDYYSGFVRQTSGRLPGSERRLANLIRRLHGPVGVEVHIFPRRVDAAVLGGLQSLIGEAYMSARTITARYQYQGSRLQISNLMVDGKAVRGRIDLSTVRYCRNITRSKAT